MPRHKVIMPKIGIYTEDIRLLEWLKDEGAEVRAGDLLFTLETDKVTSDVEAEDSGWLHRIVEPDALLPIGAEVGLIVTTREEYEELLAEPPRGPEPREKEPHPFLGYVERGGRHAPPTALVRADSPVEVRGRGPAVKISPRARALLAEHGRTVEALAGVEGTGPEGRITDKDVQAFLGAGREGTGAPPVAERIPLRGRRGIIASRMQQSLLTSAQLTSVLEIDVSPIVSWRSADEAGASYTSIFLALAAQALREQPILNSRVVEGEIHVFSDINVGFAVHTDEGVIVPVVHGTDRLSLPEIDARVQDLTARARGGALEAADVEGGTFTLSNSGSFPVDITTAIVNPPQSGILWIGRIRDRAVVVDGEIAVRPTVQACLTFDHRVLDGAPAAEFLGTLERLVRDFPRGSA
jgi:pyruvate/2-oxoglutarate dehydrogenase complex dihydrolipoamide acyltransferase (E2) component